MALFIFYMLLGGAQRIADFASALVPTMCTLYLVASSVILLANFQAFIVAVQSIFIHAFTPTAALGGFAGSTVFMAAREGIFKGVFVTEAGMGTSSIPHAMAQTDSPKNQGILAMYSMLVDTFFCTLSGLVALVTGVWKSGVISNALIFDAFSLSFPNIGPVVLLISITLFVLTTALGNSFNGSKSFSTFTNGKYITWYYLFACIMIFLGAITKTSTLWNGIEGVLVPLIAIPNLLGITYLIIKYKKELKLN
jgi:AGCS family alanine or glycine:cation symporter